MPTIHQIIRELFNHIPVVAWAMNQKGEALLAEGSTIRGMGFQAGQLVGHNLLEVFGESESVGLLQRALAGETFTQVGELGDRTLSTHYAPIRDDSGVQVGVVGITTDITEQLASQRELAARTSVLSEQAALLDLAHDAILVRRVDGTVSYWNHGAERILGHTRAEAVGRKVTELLRTALPVPMAEIEQDLETQGYWEGELSHTTRDGREVITASRWVLRRGQDGVADSVLQIDTDITARKQAEAAEAERQQEIIRSQARAIEELSTPLIPITDEILVMPLVGMLDSMRAQQVMENLLSGLASSRGKFAIIDITGVPVVDTAVASALIKAAHAARLLGSEVILTGIRPEVAQTLVHIDANLGSIITRGTLQSGIKHALARGSRKLGA